MRNRIGSLGTFGVQTVSITLIALVVTGCAAKRHNSNMLLNDFETVTIQAKIRPTEGAHANTRNSAALAESASVKGGAVAGALSSLACGPAVLFCLPFFTTSGAIIGMTTTSIPGADDDIFGLYPPKTANQVETVLSDIEDRRDFFYEMRDSLVDAIPQTRQADMMVADVAIYLGPENFELVRAEGSFLALRLTASLFAEWKRGEEISRTEERQYVYTTSERPVAYWLQNEGQAFDKGFTECVKKVTQMMRWDIVLPGR
jgi:hypothetical protein